MTDSGPVSGAEVERARGTEGEHETGAARPAADGARWPFWLPVGVLFVGLVLTGVLVWISASTYSSNEKRLLNLRVKDAGALIAGQLPTIQTPLASAAALADATDGNVAEVRAVHRVRTCRARPRVRVGVALAVGRESDSTAGGRGQAVRCSLLPRARGGVLRQTRRAIRSWA